MPGREIDGMGPDDRRVRVVHEHRGDRIEPDATPVGAAEQGRADFPVIFVVHQDDRPAHLVELSLPAWLILSEQFAELDVPLEEVGAGDFQSWIGINLAIGPVVILKERGMAVVERQKPARAFLARRRTGRPRVGRRAALRPD